MPYGRGMDQTVLDGSWLGSSGWVTLALVNAGLAEQKGRSRWNWFLVSIVLGPIATFFIVTWERVPAPGSSPRPLGRRRTGSSPWGSGSRPWPS